MGYENFHQLEPEGGGKKLISPPFSTYSPIM